MRLAIGFFCGLSALCHGFLDALDPVVINELITRQIRKYQSAAPFQSRKSEEEGHKENLRKAAANWDGKVVELLTGLDDPGE